MRRLHGGSLAFPVGSLRSIAEAHLEIFARMLYAKAASDDKSLRKFETAYGYNAVTFGYGEA